MPNECTGIMNVRGYAPNVDEFIRILQADYSYYKDSANRDYTWCADPKNFSHIPHFFRVFEAYPFDMHMHNGVYKSVCIDFNVAWSVYCCMFPGPHTYYDSYQKDHPNEHFASNILIESKRLQLEIELWSYESGMCFQEHYKICSGVWVKDEDYRFDSVWLEDYANYNEFKEKHNDCDLTENEFNTRIKDGDYFYEYNIQPEDMDFLPGDDPEYLAHLVMVKYRKDK